MKGSAKFILLHLACVVHRPRNWRFHAAGIFREIGNIQPRLASVISSIMAMF